MANNEPKKVLTVNRAFKAYTSTSRVTTHQVHLPSPSLAAGLRLLLDFSRRGHSVALTSIIRVKGAANGQDNLID